MGAHRGQRTTDVVGGQAHGSATNVAARPGGEVIEGTRGGYWARLPGSGAPGASPGRRRPTPAAQTSRCWPADVHQADAAAAPQIGASSCIPLCVRSEERRVGKE